MVTMQPQAVTKVSISALAISLPIIYVSLLRVPPSTLARDSTFWFLMSNSIIAIIAADSGRLFFSSDSHHDLSDVVPGDEQAVATVHEDYYRGATSLPLMASSYEPTAPVDICGVVAAGGGEQLPTSGVVNSKAADTAGTEEGHALALIEGEGASSKPSTGIVDHASVLQREEEEEEPIGPDKNDAMIVERDQLTLSPAPWITVTPEGDVPQDVGFVEVVEEEVKPRWTEESKPPLEKEREYWQLSDEELNKKVEEFITRFNQDMIEQEAAQLPDRSTVGLKETDTGT